MTTILKQPKGGRAGVPVSTYLPVHQVELIKARAKANDRSVNAEIRVGLRAYLAEAEAEALEDSNGRSAEEAAVAKTGGGAPDHED